LTLNIAAGADGTFSLYQDAGEGTGYQNGQSSTTAISWNNSARTLTVAANAGSYGGQPTQRSYTLRLSNSTAPTAVLVDGAQVPETAWAYNPNSRTVTVTTASLPVSATHTVTLSGSAAGNPTSGEVIGDGGLCLDVRDGVTTNGQPIQLYGCNHGAGQQVTYTSGNTIQVLGKCLDTAGGNVGNHTPIDLYDCNSTGAQIWLHRTDGTLLNPQSGRCLDDPNSNTIPGAVQLQLFDCSAVAAQIWKLPPGPVTGIGGLCLDVAGADPASATAINLYTCNQTDAQRWSAPGDGTLRAFNKCLDAQYGGTANGTPVALFDCNGTGAQVWTSRADGSLVNPQSGRCLDDPNANTIPGAVQLRLYDCNSTPAQQYHLGG
jgi:hypothetical protein